MAYSCCCCHLKEAAREAYLPLASPSQVPLGGQSHLWVCSLQLKLELLGSAGTYCKDTNTNRVKLHSGEPTPESNISQTVFSGSTSKLLPK